MNDNVLKGNIIHQGTSGVYLGFISQYPAICAQGDTIDQVKDKLQVFAKKYFDFMSNSAVEADNGQLVQF
jgi:predicted RNase H-like HicB family nuclease